MKLLRFLEGIVQVIRALLIVIIDKEARIKAIHTWKNKEPLIGFREGHSYRHERLRCSLDYKKQG